MATSDLELYTSQELIRELMRRQTFLGVVIHSENDLKGDWTDERIFKVQFNSNLEPQQVSGLLEVIADRLNCQNA
jgi:hypothetical protein